MNLLFKALTKEDAKTVVSWRYPDDYSIYNMDADDIDKEADYLINPDNHYYGIYNDTELIGHAVFHTEGRVPGGDYSLDALDIGAGMRPDWTGQGKGADIISAIIDFGREKYQIDAFRATIASWNLRAQKATTNNGFTEISRFKATKTGKEFIIFMRED